MSFEPFAISARGLRKRYRYGTRPIYRTLRAALAGHRDGGGSSERWFWALDGVSFEVAQGSAVGIVGRNGAGKSTLLKILSRITRPTEGTALIRGRVGSLLEVGTGFHPELTGRENVFLNGAILGMSKKEIERRFDDIVSFAETERFVDTQVKHYSSGMQVRLAFAVAAHLEPEVLLIDEVLAVGDAEFQRRCLGRMDEVAHEGRTVLFVSHNMSAIVRLCARALWLDRGQIVADGPSAQVVSAYLRSGLEGGDAEVRWAPEQAPGDHHSRLLAVRICQPRGVARAAVDLAEPFYVEADVYVAQVRSERDVLAIKILGREGEVALHSAEVWSPEAGVRSTPGCWRVTCEVPANTLNAGDYLLSIGIDVPLSHIVFAREGVLSFTVEPGGPQPRNYDPRAWSGTIAPGAVRWSVEQTDG